MYFIFSLFAVRANVMIISWRVQMSVLYCIVLYYADDMRMKKFMRMKRKRKISKFRFQNLDFKIFNLYNF